MSRDLLIQLCGLHSFAFALFHLAFWKLFDWKHDLRKTRLATRAITQILNLRLIYFFLGCVVVAGVYGAYSVNKRIFFVQALPALIAVAAICAGPLMIM